MNYPLNNLRSSNLVCLLPAALFLLILPFNHTIALRFLCLFLAAAIALRNFFKLGVPPLPLKLPLALWAGIAGLSLTWSFDPLFSLNELKTEIGYGLLAFFIFFTLTREAKIWRLWLNLVVLSLALTLAVSLFRYYASPLGYDWDDVHGYVSYSTYLATVTPFLLVWLKNLRGNFRWLGALLLCVYIWVAYLNANRMFWVSFIAVLLVFAVIMSQKTLKGKAKHRTVAILAIGVAVSIILFISVAKHHPPDASAPTTTGPHIISTFANSERYRIWEYWLGKIAEHPLDGVGFGRDLPHFVYQKPADWPSAFFAHAHNVVLNYALQMGIPGALALLLLFGAMAREFWHLTRHPDVEAWETGLVGLALVVAVFTKNMTDDLFWRTDALLFWALVGLLLGYGARLKTINSSGRA